jgi:glutamate synthase domain-containing protein 3
MVDLEPVLAEGEQQGKVARDVWHLGQADEAILRRLIENHARYTDSRQAKQILADWAKYRTKFVKVFPKEYRRALAENAAASRKAVA